MFYLPSPAGTFFSPASFLNGIHYTKLGEFFKVIRLIRFSPQTTIFQKLGANRPESF
jgi:hypothetical protein